MSKGQAKKLAVDTMQNVNLSNPANLLKAILFNCMNIKADDELDN
ncbi:hypothetical protein [Peribacillus sp. NPDC056705]